MSKGEEKQIGQIGRKADRPDKRGSIRLLVNMLPSMPKGETVRNVVIDGKGA